MAQQLCTPAESQRNPDRGIIEKTHGEMQVMVCANDQMTGCQPHSSNAHPRAQEEEVHDVGLKSVRSAMAPNTMVHAVAADSALSRHSISTMKMSPN